MIPDGLFLASLQTPAAYGGTEGPDLTRYLTVCIVLLSAIAGVAFLFRRLVVGTLKSKAAGRSMQVLDMLPLGGKQRLCVVRCYDRTFALGLADHGVSLISELDPVVGEEHSKVLPSRADVQAFANELERAPVLPPPNRPAVSDAPAPRARLARRGLFA